MKLQLAVFVLMAAAGMAARCPTGQAKCQGICEYTVQQGLQRNRGCLRPLSRTLHSCLRLPLLGKNLQTDNNNCGKNYPLDTASHEKEIMKNA